MDNILSIRRTADTPEIEFNSNTGELLIAGKSLPENAAIFYNPVLEWMTEYSKKANSSTNFLVKLEYFNTASSKLLLDLLIILEDIENATIKWYYLEEDYDMEEAGEEFSDIIEVPFEFIEVEDE